MPFTPRCTSPGCAQMGVFGEHVRLLQDKVGTWYCSKHAPEYLKRPNYPKTISRAPETKHEPDDQPRLF